MHVWKDLLTQGLEDDDWGWDWTTLGTLQASRQKLKAKIVAKSHGIWAADPLLDAVNHHPENNASKNALQVSGLLRDGERFKPGTVVAELRGPGRLLLAFERPLLNLASFVSGIATRTGELVSLVKAACPRQTPRVASTRKTLPGYRDLSIHGVLAGGGSPHRMSLSGGVLIKENHIAAAGGIRKAIEGARKVAPHGLKVEIEVRDLQELKEALQAQAEVVMLDNFTPEQVKRALGVIQKLTPHPVRPCIEISGGLNERNIASFAIEGVDILSVGSLTHSVKAVDLSLLVEQ